MLNMSAKSLFELACRRSAGDLKGSRLSMDLPQGWIEAQFELLEAQIAEKMAQMEAQRCTKQRQIEAEEVV